MKRGVVLIFGISLFAITNQIDESCLEHTSCNHETEYNKYIECLHDMRRDKRSTGCEEDCESIDCNQCGQKCTPQCQECGDCSYPCRKCCSETCSTNLCCTKTCHNQCRTNHCRTVCKKECKQRMQESVSSHVSGTQNSSNYAKHNITTIINLHNIINNTNLIDIPIKINNTNYNNITLRREGDGFVQVGGQQQFTQESTTSSSTNENCCAVVGPRQCVNVNYFPYTRCFHYRHRKCGSLCTSPILHTQHQRLCHHGDCHNRLTYIPQPRSSCHYNPIWPYVLCGQGNNLQNCHGCYDHYTSQRVNAPYGRCSKCYDDGFGIGPYYRQGPFYRPGYSHTPPCWQVGTCGYPMMAPAFPYYPNFYGYNPMMMNYGGMYPGGYYPPPVPFAGYPIKSNDPGYAVPTYVHELNIPNPELTLKSGESNNENNSSNLTVDIGDTTFKNPRYAVIAIDTSKPHEQKDKRVKRKKDKGHKTDKAKTNNDVTSAEEKENTTFEATDRNTTEKSE